MWPFFLVVLVLVGLCVLGLAVNILFGKEFPKLAGYAPLFFCWPVG